MELDWWLLLPLLLFQFRWLLFQFWFELELELDWWLLLPPLLFQFRWLLFQFWFELELELELLQCCCGGLLLLLRPFQLELELLELLRPFQFELPLLPQLFHWEQPDPELLHRPLLPWFCQLEPPLLRDPPLQEELPPPLLLL